MRERTTASVGATADSDEADARGDCRCLCGSLLARVLADGVELKCRRCKRTLLVPLAGGHPLSVDFVPVREVG